MAVPQAERLVAEQRGMGDRAAEGRVPEEPRMMIVDRERVGLDLLRSDEEGVGDELLADLKALVGEGREIHRPAPFRLTSVNAR